MQKLMAEKLKQAGKIYYRSINIVGRIVLNNLSKKGFAERHDTYWALKTERKKPVFNAPQKKKPPKVEVDTYVIELEKKEEREKKQFNLLRLHLPDMDKQAKRRAELILAGTYKGVL